jgi:hypothetical protein
MKSLLISLLFVSLAAGQTQTELKKEWEKRNPPSMLQFYVAIAYDSAVVKFIVGADTLYLNVTTGLDPLFDRWIVRRWDAYAKEYQVDSTARFYVTHREPTFTGFMEFLKRRN